MYAFAHTIYGFAAHSICKILCIVVINCTLWLHYLRYTVCIMHSQFYMTMIHPPIWHRYIGTVYTRPLYRMLVPLHPARIFSTPRRPLGRRKYATCLARKTDLSGCTRPSIILLNHMCRHATDHDIMVYPTRTFTTTASLASFSFCAWDTSRSSAGLQCCRVALRLPLMTV